MRKQAWRFDSDGYPFQCEIVPRYTDVDTWRHINNVAVQEMHLEARMRHQMALLGSDAWYADALRLRPKRVNTHFLRVSEYPQPLLAGVRVLGVDDYSYRIAVALFQDGYCVGIQDSLIAAWQGDEQLALPVHLREALARDYRPVDALEPLDVAMPLLGDHEGYPLQGELSARYGDLDADSGVGEAAIARFMEQGRSTLVRQTDLGGLGMVVASVDIAVHSYRPVGGPVVLPIGVSRLGHSSFVVQSLAVRRERLVGASESVMVLTDRRTGKPAPMSDAFREQLRGFCLPSATVV